MAKKATTAEPTAQPEPPPERNKPGGRLIGSWKKDVFARLPGAPDQEIADALNKIAEELGYDYKATAETVHKWREDTGPAQASPRSRWREKEKTEPTLTDLLLVKEAGAKLDAETIRTVAALAERVGGIGNLSKCLEALAKLAE